MRVLGESAAVWPREVGGSCYDTGLRWSTSHFAGTQPGEGEKRGFQ